MKKVIVLIIVLIIIGGGFLWRKNTNNQKIKESNNFHQEEKPENNQKSNDLQTYKNDKYGYTIQYPENSVEIVLDDVFERGTEGNPSFKINNGGHFALGVWENPKNLTAKEWIDEQYAAYSGEWGWGFEETTAGKEKAYSALRTDMCYIEWIIIPKLNRFYTFGVEICEDNHTESLKTFQEIVSSFKFTKN